MLIMFEYYLNKTYVIYLCKNKRNIFDIIVNGDRIRVAQMTAVNYVRFNLRGLTASAICQKQSHIKQ